MIVDPDFFDHWRTAMLIDSLGKDQMAPLYVLRIWAHCQSRKATNFSMPAKGLKALCRYTGDEALLESSLIDAGFITRDGGVIEVIGWAEHNAKLISNWENGGKGGRPKKTEEEPKENPIKTQPQPTETQPEPIREDEIRLDENKSSEKPKTEASQRASRLPPDWIATDEYLNFCKTERPDLDPQMMQDKFRDYWTGVPGKQGLKTNWLGTWRNFIRSERAPSQPRASPSAKPEKFDPTAYVNRNRKQSENNERTIVIDELGEPI